MKKIELIANCQFSGGSSPKPGVSMKVVKLQVVQDAKGPNAPMFTEGVGNGTLDLTKVTADVQGQFIDGQLYKITLEPIQAP